MHQLKDVVGHSEQLSVVSSISGSALAISFHIRRPSSGFLSSRHKWLQNKFGHFVLFSITIKRKPQNISQ
jgi:hypothetical protein